MAEKKKAEEAVEVIENELCPFCNEKKLTLTEAVREVPYFGNCHLFGMDCSGCGYHKADVEPEEKRTPSKYTFEITKEEDMKIRVVKSADATVKIPHIGSIEPGEFSNGYVTNIEGVLNRIKKQVEVLRDTAEEEEDRKKAKNILKKMTRIMWGQENCKFILEDPSGNSAIISEKTVIGKL
ncbi:MAG: ZPR1 zinc finger domain-containing protein [Nanoarchaeota archaeon]